jgi:HAD superfamily hydrolase (TIGR01509 family)
MWPRALLLDVDGTLVDNTRQHIGAWRDAFASVGLTVDEETLRRNIGKGGDLFVRAVAGEEWDREHGQQTRKLHGEAYKRHLAEVKPVPGVTTFLRDIRDLGIRPVLASSSKPDEVEANLKVIGEKANDFLIVDKDDIGTSKPAADVFAVALNRSGVQSPDTAAVGDTRWDAEAARKVGVQFFGVLTGAGTREELVGAGAERVFTGLLDLLESF